MLWVVCRQRLLKKLKMMCSRLSGNALNILYERYEKPLFIVENGYGAVDVKKEDGTCNDSDRIAYLRTHIEEMKKAVCEDGVELIGYTPWDWDAGTEQEEIL